MKPKDEVNNEGDDIFLYVVEKIQPEGLDNATWQGKIVQMQRSFKREISNVRTAMGSHQKETRTLVKGVEEETIDSKAKVYKMMGMIDDVDKKMDATTCKIEQIFKKLDMLNDE